MWTVIHHPNLVTDADQAGCQITYPHAEGIQQTWPATLPSCCNNVNVYSVLEVLCRVESKNESSEEKLRGD